MAAFRDRIQIGSAAGLDMQGAVMGNRGYGEMLDHLGVPVVTAWTYLPSYRWGITVKQDSTRLRELFLCARQAIGAFMAVAVVLVFVVARSVSISRPIREAAPVAERQASGDSDGQGRGRRPGEAGQLRAVEAMTNDLRSLIGKIKIRASP